MLRQNHMARAISCGHIFAVEQGLMLVISGWIHLGKAPGIPQSEKPTSCRLLDRIALKGHHGRNPPKLFGVTYGPNFLQHAQPPSWPVAVWASELRDLRLKSSRWGGVHTQPSTEKWKKISEILPW